MRSSTRPALFTPATGLWIISCAMVFLSVLVAPPARGQAPESGEWSPKEVRPVESAGEVVLTFTRFHPGRTVYYTRDGDCYGYHPAEPSPVSPGYCRRPLARAGEDYGAVRGEWIFTEAGSRTITIPILEDDLDEADEETFRIMASQHDDVAGTTAWYSREIRIKDDDPKDDADAPSAGSAFTATTARGRSPSSSNARTISGSDDGDAEIQPGSGSEPVSGELGPGPGFEVAIERDSEPVPERGDWSGDSASWLALGLGAIALATVGVVWVRRRRRVAGLWILSCAIVFVSVLVAPPASGQTRNSRWSPSWAQPLESDGEIVLTFTSQGQGRVRYYTRDDCPTYPWESQECGRPMARASEDFGAVKGEWIFTEAGSRTITIQIFDDDLDETDIETFYVGASFYNDLGQQTTWDSATIRIADDDPKRDSGDPPATRSTITRADDRPSGSLPVKASPPATASSSSEPDAGSQPGAVNVGNPAPEVEVSAGNEAEPIATDTRREDKSLPVAGLGALALVTSVAAGLVFKKRFGRRTT